MYIYIYVYIYMYIYVKLLHIYSTKMTVNITQLLAKTIITEILFPTSQTCVKRIRKRSSQNRIRPSDNNRKMFLQ